MDRRQVIEKLKSQLIPHFSDSEASRLAQYLLEDLLTDPTTAVEDRDLQMLSDAALRLIKGEPIQYVTHRADFYGYQFYVDNAVLIPRPETEELVYTVLEYIKKSKLKSPQILDIGTGSGCIPIAIKKEWQDCQITAVDISADALRVAIKNASTHGVELSFEEVDVLNLENETAHQAYDIIISNPPYIPYSEKPKMGNSVIAHEPNIALFTDDEYGLVFYQKIASLCNHWLAKSGAVFLELNEFHAVRIKSIFELEGSFSKVNIIKDMQNKPRILEAIR